MAPSGAGLSYFGYENDVSNDSVPAGAPFRFDSSSDYNSGIGTYAALGYAWESGLRTELEFAYRNADIDQIDPWATQNFTGWPSGSISGDTSVYSIMVNFPL